ncbi:MAG TPA: hypothetical protein VGV40_09640 [Solirubrobacteraceae bacterium]|nr:hypothetical protein [Solirubrobacteraceae bacterium]
MNLKGGVIPALWTVATLTAFALVLTAQGYVPGMINSGSWNALLEGSMRCLDGMGVAALTSSCQTTGAPVGFPLLSSGPLVYLGVAFMKLPGVGSYGGFLLAGAASCAFALAGGYGLMRRLGTGRAIALVVAAAFLLSPTVLGLRAFGGTFQGFTLLPAYVLVDLVMIDALERRGRRGIALALVAFATARTFALVLDGYSFVAAGLVSFLLWLGWALRGQVPERRRLLGLAGFLAVNVVAVGFFRAWVPSDWATEPIDFSRAFGLDLVTLLLPTDSLAVASALGLARDHSDLWGDSSSWSFNYLGLGCLVLAGGRLIAGPRPRFETTLAVAGCIAFVLALGPSLKLADTRAAAPYDPPTVMPAQAASVELPWGAAVASAPGLDSTRASYRWFAVTRLALIVLAGLAVQQALGRRNRTWMAAGVAVGLVALVEIAPNLPLLVHDAQRLHGQTTARRAALDADLRAATGSGERVFFLDTSQAHVNQFAVNDLATAGGLTTYNTGGDKNAALAQQRWPAPIAAIQDGGGSPDAAALALESGAADAIVVPAFSLWRAVESWPPAPGENLDAQRSLKTLAGDSRLRVRRFKWFATIRLADRTGRVGRVDGDPVKRLDDG